MKAVVYKTYGSPDVLEIKDVANTIPKNNEVLVKVESSTVTAGVILIRKGIHPDSKFFSLVIRLIYGLNKPKISILGYEFAGKIVKIGDNVTRFKVGDKVFGTTTGLKQGAYAEYVSIPEKWNQGVISQIPDGLSYDKAASLPIGGMTAMYLLNKGKINNGNKVLIYGGSGSVGTYAIQIAKYQGAEVTGVCSTQNIELLKSIGADHVIDYKKKNIYDLQNKYDLIIDAVGKLNKKEAVKLLKTSGKFLTVKSPTSEKEEYLTKLKEMTASGHIKPVIDKTYTLDNIIQAHEYVEKGHKRGNVVIKID